MRKQSKNAFLTGIFILFCALHSSAWGGTVVVRMMYRGPAIYKKVISLREKKFIKIVPQSKDYSCGAAAMATILSYQFGKETSEADAMQGLLEVADLEVVKKKGFSLLDLKKYAENIGYRAGGFKVKAGLLPNINKPTIVLIDVRGYSHFVVLKGVRGEDVFLSDPAWGNRIMNLADFLKAWNGIVFAFDGPKLANATGLGCEDREAMPVDCILRMKSLDSAGRFIMDPSQQGAIFKTIYRDSLL
ncbi:MAG: C39 family peptidase [Thermodesulfobacteriota bacterium]